VAAELHVAVVIRPRGCSSSRRGKPARFYGFDQKFKSGQRYRRRDRRPGQKTSALRAIDPSTATLKWEFRYPTTSAAGV
jgi:hypothetical protein